MKWYARKTPLVKAGWILFICGLTATILYSVWATKQITEKMAGARWALPSRVYSAPVAFYPGVPFPVRDLRKLLTNLGYAKTSGSADTGQWREDGKAFTIGKRAYEDAGGEHAAETLRIVIEDERISTLERLSAAGAEDLFTAALEPVLLGEFSSPAREERTLVRLQDVPKTLIEALLVMEDREFYSHHGLSFRGTARALWANVRGARVAQGGSTLTQQLMKNFFLSPERTITRKAKEAIFTVTAELLYSKDELLEAYLNEIYLGQRGSVSIHGFGEAAKFYFSKPLAALSLAEQATLVGLITSPGSFSPYRNAEAALRRRNLVLDQLALFQKVDAGLVTQAKAAPLLARGRLKDQQLAPYFVDFVRKELRARFPETSLENEGYRIYTTMDPLLQADATIAVADGLAALEKRTRKKNDVPDPANPLQAALIALQPKTGAIKAWIGGRAYSESQFDRASSAIRQPGSAVKPFVAAVAFSKNGEKGPAATPASLFPDRPDTFTVQGKEWSPQNYERKYFGEATVRTAMEHSLNAATINLAAKVGLGRLSEQFGVFGFRSSPELPSLVLGAIEVTPLELATSYTAFANAGLRASPQAIHAAVHPEGGRLQQKSLEVKRVMASEAAFLVTNVLQGVLERGTAKSARALGVQFHWAGKTGTTDDYRDSWFVGFSPSLLVAVWVGYDDQRRPTGLTGASGALQIWTRLIRMVEKRSTDEEFEVPDSIVWAEVDPILGCRKSGSGSLREAFIPGTEPPECR